MFSKKSLHGRFLPVKTLCLTFDDGPGETTGDGPGPKTIKIAEYLHEQGISATFFMVGKHISKNLYILPELHRLGHIIGNHTYNHLHFPSLFKDGKDILTEITKTSELISQYINNKTISQTCKQGVLS